ncbi:hypothetical protein FUAX_20680 [Fulvitalea axinellae]|uniref:F5/8 type C domain-containing protein n=1 Tax=Fulvitalea axinellae TaxID=1182444 RepID=A0AAU9CBU4_9BACT|nr:hypothetical protein FUAX_20680 [Fulvitalea axinellae]
MKSIYRVYLALCLGGALASSCEEAAVDLNVPGEDPFDRPVLHVLNDVSQYWNPDLFGDEARFLSYLDTANFQGQTISFPSLALSDVNGKNAWNIFLNTENNTPYSAQDVSSLLEFGKSNSVCFFAMGDGSTLANLNSLTKNFGFSMEAGPVTDLSAKDGATLKASNSGSFLTLDKPADWDVLATSASKPVVAVKREGEKIILASGVDLFSNKAKGNIDFYKAIMKNVAEKAPGFQASNYTNYANLFTKVSEGEFTYSSNLYSNEALPKIQEQFATVLSGMKDFSGFEDGSSPLKINLVGGSQMASTWDKSVVLGTQIGGFPQNDQDMRVSLAKSAFHWLSNFKQETLGDEAVALYAALSFAEANGDADAKARFLDPMIAKAKKDPAYASYDPFTMSAEERGAVPAEVRTAKFLEIIKMVEAKGTDLQFMDFIKTRNENTPNFTLKSNLNNVVWAFGEWIGDQDMAFSAFADAGYSADPAKVNAIGVFEKLDPLGEEFGIEALVPGHEKFPITKVFDGIVEAGLNPENLWLTPWTMEVPYPHPIVVDMKSSRELAMVSYLPHQISPDVFTDLVTKAKIYVSDDKNDWGDPVADYVLIPEETDLDWKFIPFDAPKKGRYMKFEINGFIRNGVDRKMSLMQELELYQVASGTDE